MFNAKEVLLLAALLCFVMFLVLYSAKDSKVRGIDELLLANVLGLCAYILYAFGRELPPLPAYEGANAMYASSSVATLIGIRKLFGRDTPTAAAALSVAVLVALIAVFHYIHPSFAARTFVVSFYQVGIAYGIVQVALASRRTWQAPRYPIHFIIVMSSFIAAGHTYRTIRQLLDPGAPTALLDPTGWNLFFLAAGAFALPVLSLGGLLVVHRAILRAAEDTANRDFLTGTWSRKAFFEACEREIARARRTGQPLCLMLVDLDHLKAINDHRGHAAGDAALIQLVGTANQCFRTIDCVGRIGGDEFSVVMPDTGLEGAAAAANRFREAFRGAGRHCHPEASVSIGISTFQPDDSLTSLLERADAALYYAKDAGRNRVVTETSLEARTGSGW